MSGNAFIDTNVFVYAFQSNDERKRAVARGLLEERLKGRAIVISTQILSEVYATMSRYRVPHESIKPYIYGLIERANVVGIDLPAIVSCLDLKERYGFSYWDSLVLSAALSAKCGILYSEDFQDGQVIEASLTVVNPFADRSVDQRDAD
jgi:predicted nucleic acid-binding protein